MTQLTKYYRGFSTKHYLSTGKFDIYNVQLIEEDLVNELMTVQGERLEMPEFGTRVPLLIHEPNDEETADVLREDMTTVINNDPRVELIDLDVISDADRMVLIGIAKVRYIEFNVTQDLRIEIGSGT